MPNLRSIVLAAGKGTRMRSELPKVLHKVCGQSMIEYVLDITCQVRSLSTYVVVGHGADQVKQTLGGDVSYVLQDKQLGTGDAVRRVLPLLKGYTGDVLILCGDTPLLQADIIKALIAKHRRSRASVTVLTARLKDPSGYGRIVRNSAGNFLAIREQKNASDAERAINEINVGVYCFKAKDLVEAAKSLKPNSLTKEFYLTDAIEYLLAKAKLVDTLVTDDETTAFGVNTRIHLSEAEKIIRQRILNKHMIDGVTIVDPATTYIENNVKIAHDTIIYPCSYIHANVVIGANCKIGPFARIRSGSRLADSVEIGNFAEVSRSSIGRKTMMKHFSFLGDAVVGSEVNIGAGTVTANYDGKNKNKTTIADRAFIGSDSILVAPVSVGKSAITGAGSVLRKNTNVPAHKKAVGVPARIL